MEKKLYRVKVTLFVMAENEADACMAATNAKFDIFECTAKKADHLIPGWEDAIPYNSDDQRTCAEILAGQEKMIYLTPAFMADMRHINTAARAHPI
jgi:hypothetical protein